ncbi:MAG: 4Fe-4S binding protein [Actinobacteria bacterium]|nr:4Fe-4S binding protein [Actinomycetota bacterium]MBI3686339.1 4Fe-4S binding protein [Actinomycetota bacterium]
MTAAGPRPLMAAVLRSRLYPGVLQWATAAVFVLVGYELLAGPRAAHDNLGTALTWVVWWPVIPVVFVLVGRFWCAICPFGTLSDAVQRLVGVHRPVPRFLRRYGIWVIDAQFIAITWADHVWGIVASPWGTGVLLLLLTTAVVASGAFFQRRTFCRHLCFLGGLSGNYARTGMVALRADQAICATCTARAACYHGGPAAPACPLFEFPRTMDSAANCNLCANCVKNCPNDALTLTVRPPTTELWTVRKPVPEHAFLAAAIMGIVFIQNITMLGVWTDTLAWVARTTGLSSIPIVFTLAFTVAIAAPTLLLAAASWVAARRGAETTWRTFARFGYALIPLDIAGHLAHNLFHLLAEGKAVLITASALVGAGHAGGSTALVSGSTIRLIQYGVLAAGIAGSGYTVWRISRARYGAWSGTLRAVLIPNLVLLTVLSAVNVVLFAMPMTMRM